MEEHLFEDEKTVEEQNERIDLSKTLFRWMTITFILICVASAIQFIGSKQLSSREYDAVYTGSKWSGTQKSKEILRNFEINLTAYTCGIIVFVTGLIIIDINLYRATYKKIAEKKFYYYQIFLGTLVMTGLLTIGLNYFKMEKPKNLGNITNFVWPAVMFLNFTIYTLCVKKYEDRNKHEFKYYER